MGLYNDTEKTLRTTKFIWTDIFKPNFLGSKDLKRTFSLNIFVNLLTITIFYQYIKVVNVKGFVRPMNKKTNRFFISIFIYSLDNILSLNVQHELSLLHFILNQSFRTWMNSWLSKGNTFKWVWLFINKFIHSLLRTEPPLKSVSFNWFSFIQV